jgi:adenine nucleotide transporter 17
LRAKSWLVNTHQTVQASLDDSNADGTVQIKRDPKTGEKVIVRKLGFLQTIMKIYKKDGLLAFFRGLGPALILVINPIIAYTTFEQLKNLIIARRSTAAARLPTRTQSITSKPTVLPLSDLDNFVLAALCKLLATGVTYPYLVVKVCSLDKTKVA